MRTGPCALVLIWFLAPLFAIAQDRAPEKPIAWGKEVGGLTAGLRYAESKSPAAVGDVVNWEVVVRNTSQATIQVPHVPPSAFLGRVQDDQILVGPVGIGKGFESTRTLQPGQDLLFGASLLLLPPKPTVSPARPFVEITPGKYRISAPHVLLRRDGSDAKLSTGALELEVVPMPMKQP